MRPLVSFISTCVLAASVAGCSRFERISQCRELAQTVNEHMTEIEEASKAKETPQTYAKLAQRYGALADEVAGLPAAKGAASAQVADYVALLRSAAGSCRETSEALKAGTRTDTPRRDLDRLSRKDKLIAQKLETYCHTP